MKLKNLGIMALICGAGFLIQGCREQGPAERAGHDIDRGAERAKDKVKDAADKTGDAVKDAGRDIKDATK